jgi:hypothetical protein
VGIADAFDESSAAKFTDRELHTALRRADRRGDGRGSDERRTKLATLPPVAT